MISVLRRLRDASATCLICSGWLVSPGRPLPVGSDVETELRGNHYPFAMGSKRLAYDLFICEWAISFRRIEERYAALDPCSDYSYGLLFFDGLTVAIT